MNTSVTLTELTTKINNKQMKTNKQKQIINQFFNVFDIGIEINDVF